MSAPRGESACPVSSGPRITDTLGMKLHVNVGDDEYRVAEFFTENRLDFHISLAQRAAHGEFTTVTLDRREAKALRHWLDAAIE